MASNKEKPLGPYPKADYDFLALMNNAVSWERTKEEEAIKRSLLHEAHLIFQREDKDKIQNLMSEISSKGVNVIKLEAERDENVFTLEYFPVDVAVEQGERRTMIYFLPDKKMRFDPPSLYKLFFEKLPNSMYEKGSFSPEPEDIKNSTSVTVTTKTDKRKSLELKKLSDKEEFEDLFNNPEKIIYISMDISTDRGISYKLSLPNPKGAGDRYLQFSFPSRDNLTEETMGVLLSLHQDFRQLNGDEPAYIKTFAENINLIKDRLRVK